MKNSYFRAPGPEVVIPLPARSWLPLDAHGDAHAAADAEGGEAALRIALLHFVEEGDEDPCPGGADRMAERDRAAIDVDDLGVPAEVLVDRAGLRREGLVGL